MPFSQLTPEGYIPRVADGVLERALKTFAAVEVAGTKWCGKTWTSLAHGRSVSYIDDDYDLAVADPKLMTLGDAPHVIDEWQLVPATWDAVRREADKTRGVRGGWILTGSSTPLVKDDEDKKGAVESKVPKHSGAGRIARVRMYPMSLAESGDSSCSVSLSGLFRGDFAPAVLAEEFTEAKSLVGLACRGGWPEVVGMDPASAQAIAREYLRALYDDTAPRAGKNDNEVSKLVASVSRTLGQAATQKTLFSDMAGEPIERLNSAQKAHVADYLAFLKSTYVVEEVPGWVPASRSPKRLQTKPKRYLADPSLACAQLGMGTDALLHDWQTFGMVFENLCMRDLLVYTSALSDAAFSPVKYYRDDSGLEADAIIELADGRWAAIEVKVSEDKVKEGLKSLRALRKKLCENPAARTRPPEFMAVIVGLSRYARKTDDGICVVPIRALGA